MHGAGLLGPLKQVHALKGRESGEEAFRKNAWQREKEGVRERAKGHGLYVRTRVCVGGNSEEEDKKARFANTFRERLQRHECLFLS